MSGDNRSRGSGPSSDSRGFGSGPSSGVSRAQDVPDWFRGAVDIHVHSSPSIFPRLLDDQQVVEQAGAAGMRAVVLKAHEGSTVERAALASDSGGAVVVRGGLVLNRFVGGLNPQAVELAIALGAAIVWMPTLHAENHLDHYGEAGFREQSAGYRPRPVDPVTILDEAGRLNREATEVLELLAAHPPVVLSNGHLGAEETRVLFREAQRMGVARMVLAHPELPLSGYDLDFQLEMVSLGALVERCYLPHTEHWGGFPVARTASEIERLGAQNCVLSTDFGQRNNPAPAAGLLEFGRRLGDEGVSPEALELMLKRNPAGLLGLD